MNLYYIVSVTSTQEAGHAMFWAAGKPDTPTPAEALQVNEDHLIANLARFDNGTTTRAVLCDAVNNHHGDVLDLLDRRLKRGTAA